MNKRFFKVGDRVSLTVDHPDNNQDLVIGNTGTVVDCDTYEDEDYKYMNVGVEFDNKIKGGHNCCGHCADSYGWYVHATEICLVAEEEYDMIAVSDEELAALLS